MKFQITFKTPDAVEDAIKGVLHDMIVGICSEDREDVGESEAEEEQMRVELQTCADKYVQYGEYVVIQFDTEENTAKVIPVKK